MPNRGAGGKVEKEAEKISPKFREEVEPKHR